MACRLVDVREGTRVSNEGRLEACRLARCRQPRARGAQRSGFRTWRRRRRVSKPKFPAKNLTEWRVASNQRSSFSVFKNQRRRFIEPCFPSLLFVLLPEIPRGHERRHCRKQFGRIPARLVLSYVPLTACTHHPGSANPESTPTPPAGSDPCRRSRGNLGESRT